MKGHPPPITPTNSQLVGKFPPVIPHNIGWGWREGGFSHLLGKDAFKVSLLADP